MKGISETAFATQVEDLLRRFQWRFFHIKPAMTGKGAWVSRMNPEGKGLPDYIAVRRGRLIFAELKDANSKTTPEQDEWLEDVRECVKQIMINPVPVPIGRTIKHFPSLEVYLWRSSDIDEIIEVLR